MSEKENFSKSECDELLQCFHAESLEHLDGIEPLLLQLETASPEEQEGLTNQVFRAAHSIKGSSGMFGFTQIYELSHKTEWLLDFVRSGKVRPSTELVDVLLRSFDCLRNLVENSAQSNSIDISAVRQNLDQILQKIEGDSKEKPKRQSDTWPAPSLMVLPTDEIKEAQKMGLKVYFAKLELIEDLDKQGKSLQEFLKLLNGFGLVMRLEFDFDSFADSIKGKTPVLPMEIAYSSEINYADIEMIFEISADKFQLLASTEAEKTSVIVSGVESEEKCAVVENLNSEAQPVHVQEKAEPTLRVKVSLLEDLMNLAGELVLSRNQLREGLNRNDMRAIRISGQRMGQVTSELQETIMMTRLQPLDRVFSKFPRMIRDLCKDLQKEIVLTMEGREVELDKTLIEGLGDPLTHMVRNAADHGVESPSDRIRAGKSNPASIKLQAFYEASRVIIEVADDGRGIDGEKVCNKAVERGLISLEKARSLSTKEKQNLIFLPGLSTADKVSQLSGRGVGMDVVKANIDRLGGKVEIVSELGKGSAFRIKLPLTLAIIPSLILTTSGEMFAIPQLNVLEMLLIPPELVKKRIRVIGTQDVLVLRGKLLPLISLNHFLAAPGTFFHPESGIEEPDRRKRLADRRSPRHSESSIEQHHTVSGENKVSPREDGRRYHAASGVNVVIVTTGNFSFGIVVDKPLFTEEIVVKQLGSDLKGLTEYSGATIMGDGRIALIIDVLGLASRANILGQNHALNASIVETASETKPDLGNVPFLAFHYGGMETFVLPLFLVERLEKIKLQSIITCGKWKAIQHGERILPVFLLSDTSQVEPLSSDQECGVIVIKVRNREIGLIAALPIQVNEMRPDFDVTVLRQPGIGGSKVWHGKSILFVDIWEILALQRPELLEFEHDSAYKSGQAPQVLILEPVEFFQRQIRLQMENKGFGVLLARNWDEVEHVLLKQNNGLCVFLADLGMIKQNSFARLRKLRSQNMLKGIQIAGMRINETEKANELSAEGVVQIFQKLENEHLHAWFDDLKSRMSSDSFDQELFSDLSSGAGAPDAGIFPVN